MNNLKLFNKSWSTIFVDSDGTTWRLNGRNHYGNVVFGVVYINNLKSILTIANHYVNRIFNY